MLAAAPVDANKSPVLARRWQRASATVGLGRLAIEKDPAEGLRLAREAAALIGADPPFRNDQTVLGEARLVEGQALQAEGQTEAAHSAMDAAVGWMAKAQVPDSPRLIEARAALARLTR
ncbi:MAG: hypothetical protein ABI330_16770 [Caldimonas sp.]